MTVQSLSKGPRPLRYPWLVAMAAVLTLGLAAGSATAQKAAPAPLSIEDRALVTRASAYLQGLSLAKGRFVQTDPRGARTSGDLYLKRPGKMRFAYDPPQGLLVVSDGFNVSIADQRLKTFDRYPLGSTPLALLLAREIRLDRGVIIDRVTRLSDGFSITARDGRKEAEGRIQLVFTTAPMGLKSWTVTDAQGQSTRVDIDRLTPVASLDPSLFVLRDPRATAPGPLKGPR